MPSSAGGAAAQARSQARAILAERRFHLAPIPRPLHGVLHAIGRVLETPLEALGELVSGVAVSTPGGAVVVWSVLAAAVLAISAIFAVRGSRRALREPGADTAHAGRQRPVRASELERAAADAEARGRHQDAVRLRFRAGLLRLAERELVGDAPSMLNAEVSRALRSERFDALARRFEEIAYGGRTAVAEDSEAARRDWSQLLDRGERA
jgi:hypothetical protein